MKRVLASLLAAGFLLTAFVPALATGGATDALETKVLVNYADKSTEDDATEAVHIGSQTTGSVAYIPSVRGGDGASLKLMPKEGGAAGRYNFAVKPSVGQDVTGMEAVELYIKKVQGTDGADNGVYGFSLADGEREYFGLKAGSEVYYIVKGEGTLQKATVASNNITLPVGFEGVVRLPLASMNYSWGGSGDKQLTTDDIFNIQIAATVGTDTYLAVDEVRGISDIEYIDPSLLPPEPADSVVLANYADKATTDDATEALHTTTNGKGAYIPSIRGNEGSSLKLMAPASDVAWCNFALKPTIGWDVTGMEAIELYVKKVQGSDNVDNGVYKFAIGEGGGGQWETFRPAVGSEIYYIAKGEGTLRKVVSLSDGSFRLPVGFEGVIRLPIDQLDYYYGGTGGDNQLQLDNLYSIAVATDVSAETYLVVDEIRGIRDSEALDPSLTPEEPGGEEALKVLFVGNSATAVNNMPQMFARLSQEAGHDVTVDSLTWDGCTLARYADPDDDAGKALRSQLSGGYDVVFLQDNTNCISNEERREASKAAVKTIDELVKAAGGETYLYVRPPVEYANFGYSTLQQIEEYTKLFDEVGKEIGAPRAYANEAFGYMVENYPDIEIWAADDAHPNEQGSFLVACVCFATLFDESPADVYDGGFDADVAQAIWEAADAAASGSGSQPTDPDDEPGTGPDDSGDEPTESQKKIILANYADKTPSGDAAEALQSDSQGKASYIPNIRGGEGASLKLVADRDVMTWNAFSLKPIINWNATGMEAIELYIRKVAADADSDNGAYRFAIGEAGGTSHWEVFRLKEGATVYYMEKDGTTLKEAEVLEDGSCLLPSGFEGIVRLPLDQLEYWYGGTAGGNRQLNLDNLFNIIVTTDVNASTQYLVVDEVSAITNILYTGSDVETGEPSDDGKPSTGNPDTGVTSYVNVAVLALAASAAAAVGFKRKKK